MGNLNLGSVATTLPDAQPWWQVDLGATTRIGVIKVFNRDGLLCRYVCTTGL